MDNLLHFPGSLLSGQNIVASYDIEQGCVFPALSPLMHGAVHNYNYKPFRLALSDAQTLIVVNGMGVTLGDSIIGIETLRHIKQQYPQLRLRVLRPSRCSGAVEQLYQLARRSGVIDELLCLPQPLPAVTPDEVYVDMGNQLFRGDFAVSEMHDFFYRHMGIDETTVANEAKQNRWLRGIDLKLCKRITPDYVLFCPAASTVLRAIPSRFHLQIVECLYQQFRLPVLGFSDVEHPHYRNIANHCPDTLSFIAVIARARFLYTADSSALHIAAGFDVPTRALFAAIPPALRARYYPYCESVWTGTRETRSLHQSDDPRLLHKVEENTARLMQNGGL